MKLVCLMKLRYPWGPMMRHEVAHLVDDFLGSVLPQRMVRVSRVLTHFLTPFLRDEVVVVVVVAIVVVVVVASTSPTTTRGR